MTFFVEVEYNDPDDEDVNGTETVGPFRTRERAQLFADSLGKAAGLERDRSGFWFQNSEFRSAYVMVRPAEQARVRPLARRIKSHLRGDLDG